MSSHDITTMDQLRTLYREPSERVQQKKGDRIEGAAAEFVADSSFLCLATADAQGGCDVSPRGGPAGQLKLLNDGRTVALPDLSGNNLIDSLSNIVVNPKAGLLVMVTGSDETMRIDGTAKLTTDPEVLGLWSDELRTPKLAILIDIDDVFLHCAKAFRRGGVWNPETWPNIGDTAATKMFNAIAGSDIDPSDMRLFLEHDYKASLDAEKATAE